MLQLSQINIFPVKSGSEISVSNAFVQQSGLCFDRNFMLSDVNGTMITGRTHPKLVKIKPALSANGLVLSYIGKVDLVLDKREFNLALVATNVWKDEFSGLSTTTIANKWFSDILEQEVQLLYTGENTPRFSNKAGIKVSFADAFPLLIISESSLDYLNKRSSRLNTMLQFRTNLVVSGGSAFQEDYWDIIKIGNVKFKVDSPCERCIFTTINPNTGIFDKSEPIKTLSKFRINEKGGVDFGMNLIPLNEGVIEQNSKIEVIKSKSLTSVYKYKDNSVTKLSLQCTKIVQEANDLKTFYFKNNSSTAINYLAGQHLPIDIDINGKRYSRRYTLSSTQTGKNAISITVKRINNGFISNYLHDSFSVNDEILAEQPTGSFHLDSLKTNNKILFLSAGSGITPMISMLRYLAGKHKINDVVFYHLCRDLHDLPFQQEMCDLQLEHPNLSVIYALSKPNSVLKNWGGFIGRINKSHLSKIPDLEIREVFLCGPSTFMAKTKSILSNLGVAETQINQEYFTSSNIENKRVFEKINITINQQKFTGNNQLSILEQSESAGFNLEYGCRSGVCGACKVKLISGEVNNPESINSPLNTDEINSGIILSCCCVPTENIEISKI